MEKKIIHGGDRYGASLESSFAKEEILDFSANINPLGMSPGVREAIAKSFRENLHYPDPLCRELCAALGESEGLDPEKIICGNGGADLIYRLAYALRPKRAMVTAPSFAEYEEALRQTDARIAYWNLGEDFQIKEDMLEAVTEELDLLFLCNPNNPTGLLTKRELLLRLVEKARELGVRVCLDECFLDFVREQESYTLKGYLEKFPNLVILKSFTKLYGIPGLRLGYMMSADPKLLERIRRAGQPWAVSGPAQAAGLAALKDKEFCLRTVAFVEKERKFLQKGLLDLGFQVWEGEANYLLFRGPGETELYPKLLEQGVLIRRCGNYRGLTEEYYRAAVRTRSENERFLRALGRIRS